jgi:hypothetical protein
VQQPLARLPFVRIGSMLRLISVVGVLLASMAASRSDPPPGYYDLATGKSGAELLQHCLSHLPLESVTQPERLCLIVGRKPPLKTCLERRPQTSLADLCVRRN